MTAEDSRQQRTAAADAELVEDRLQVVLDRVFLMRSVGALRLPGLRGFLTDRLVRAATPCPSAA